MQTLYNESELAPLLPGYATVLCSSPSLGSMVWSYLRWNLYLCFVQQKTSGPLGILGSDRKQNTA